MSADWYKFDGKNHAVYFGEGTYTEFECGEDTTSDKLKAEDKYSPYCSICSSRIAKRRIAQCSVKRS